MADKVIGRFYFKQTSNGNLIGEFSNRASDGIATESCDFREPESKDLRKSIADRFLGKYYSTWQENGAKRIAELTIKPHGNSRLFDLAWDWTNGEHAFVGEGMLCDDILIGDYQSA